jgi:quercetin dioxygenase-like cupin family protein
MNIVSLTNAPKVPFDLEGYKMHSSDTLEVIHLCLKPGQSIPQHSNPFNVVACLVSGQVTVHIGDDQRVLSLYDVVELGKNMNRGFTNYSTTEARIIIMKKL